MQYLNYITLIIIGIFLMGFIFAYVLIDLLKKKRPHTPSPYILRKMIEESELDREKFQKWQRCMETELTTAWVHYYNKFEIDLPYDNFCEFIWNKNLPHVTITHMDFIFNLKQFKNAK